MGCDLVNAARLPVEGTPQGGAHSSPTRLHSGCHAAPRSGMLPRMLAAIHLPESAAPAVLVIFALTYAGIAVGHVPGLKLNRTGIALLGAIAMMIFAGVTTADVIGYINWPTILLLFGFFVLSAQLRLSGFFDRVAAGVSGAARPPGAVPPHADAGDGRALRVPQPRHRLLRLRARRGHGAAAAAHQSRPVPGRPGHRQQHRRRRHLRGQPAGHDDRPGRPPQLRHLHALVHRARGVRAGLRLRAHLAAQPRPPRAARVVRRSRSPPPRGPTTARTPSRASSSWCLWSACSSRASRRRSSC